MLLSGIEPVESHGSRTLTETTWVTLVVLSSIGPAILWPKTGPES